VVEDGEACREAVCLDEWLVVEDGEAGREAVWVVELPAWMVRLVVRLSAWLVGWWSNCHLGWLTGVVAVWVVELSAWMARLAVRLSAWTDGWWSRMVKLVVRLSAWEEGQADGDAICSDDWLVLWLSGLTAGGVAHSSLSVWMVGWS